MSQQLLPNLVRFGEVLHECGLDVPAGRMVDVVRALDHVDLGRRSDFYFTLRTLLVHRQRDLATFDEAFRLFWRPPPGQWSERDLRALGERRRFGPPRPEAPAAGPRGLGAEGPSSLTHHVDRVAPLSYGRDEVSRSKDFAEFTADELVRAIDVMSRLTWRPDERRTRRWASGRGRAIDLGRLLRRNVTYGGEPVVWPTRYRRCKPRRLVVLADVSGSMERYSRMLLHFIHAMSVRQSPAARAGVETFLFATRLTHVTRDLSRSDPNDAVRTMLGRVPDWAGGTRIGDALRALNIHWGRRVLGGGPVVLLISDGWDRGDPGAVAAEIARLRRSSHRLIWLNPLLGSVDYQPLTRAMQAALPFVDDFLPVHNLASLESLASHLNRLPVRRALKTAH